MSPWECEICLESYNCEDRRPHSLSCGHSVCSCCLGNLLKKKPLICPHCRAPHQGQAQVNVSDVPVTYALLSLLEERSRETLHRDDLIRSVKKETEDKTSVKKDALEDQIDSLTILLKDLEGQAQASVQVMSKMTWLMKHLEKIQKWVQSEIVSVREALDDASKVSQCFMESQKNLNEARTFMETAIAEEEANRCVENAEPFLQWNRMLISRRVFKNAVETHSECEAFLVIVSDWMNAPDPAPLLVRPQTSLLKTKVLKGNVTLPRLEEVLTKSSMWVVTTLEGRPRCAQISKHGNRCLLHVFQDGEPPAGSTATKFGSLWLKEDPKEAFMELSWWVERRGKIFIKMEGQRIHIDQFKHFCLGEKGVSFANTCIKKLRDYASGIICGTCKDDDETNNFITVNDAMRSWRGYVSQAVEGSVGICGDLPCISILTNVKRYSTQKNSVGYVNEGLDLVNEVSKLPDIRKVTVTDCGLVL